MKTQLCLAPLLLSATVLGAQSQYLIGTWRAEQPLPNGVIQTFRFDGDGKFDLSMQISASGQYRLEGDQLIQTVALPDNSGAKADTSDVTIGGDSLLVRDHSNNTTLKTLHRTGSVATEAHSVVGDWTIALPNGMSAMYSFTPDGATRIHVQVGDERGTYTVSEDTIRLSNDRTFQVPATATFVVRDTVLVLTPPGGHGARQFHKIAARP